MTSWTEITEEPSDTIGAPEELLASYLDFYRAAVLRKVSGLTETQLRKSLLPSGWNPLGLVNHLAHVERRWMQWGFLGEQITAPFGDENPGTELRGPRVWVAPPDRTTAEVIAFYVTACDRSRAIAAGAALGDRAAHSRRFRDPDHPPVLGWILFHLLQEYARHVGHLDIVRELTDGALGE
jgi:hypothetical protein